MRDRQFSSRREINDDPTVPTLEKVMTMAATIDPPQQVGDDLSIYNVPGGTILGDGFTAAIIAPSLTGLAGEFQCDRSGRTAERANRNRTLFVSDLYWSRGH